MIWSDDDDNLSPNEKREISGYVNQKLESCLGIRISKDINKGKCDKYVINQLFNLI